LDGEIKRKTTKVLKDIKWLDDKAESMSLDADGWRLRYELERELEEIYYYKESIWQKRCSERRFLQGMLTQLSKWFCDTFTGAATGAARCGSFVEEGFCFLVASYG
jgi:hypothetical protein